MLYIRRKCDTSVFAGKFYNKSIACKSILMKLPGCSCLFLACKSDPYVPREFSTVYDLFNSCFIAAQVGFYIRSMQ